jgi:hypothetical protein
VLGALDIQHVKRMRYIAMWPVRLHGISKPHDFRKKFLNAKLVFWFSLKLLSEIFLILRRNERDTIINIKYP